MSYCTEGRARWPIPLYTVYSVYCETSIPFHTVLSVSGRPSILSREVKYRLQCGPSPSERFVPLLRVGWDNGFDGGYNKFSKLFVHVIDEKSLVRHLTLLAAAAKLPTPIVDETCVALNTLITASILSDLDTPDMRRHPLRTEWLC